LHAAVSAQRQAPAASAHNCWFAAYPFAVLEFQVWLGLPQPMRMEAPKSVYGSGYICLGCIYQVKRVGFGAFWHVYLLLLFTRWQFLTNMFVIILTPQDFNSLQKHANVQYDSQSSYKTRGAQPGRLKSPRIPGNASTKQSSPRSADRTSSKSSSRTSMRHSVTGSRSSSSSPKWQSLIYSWLPPTSQLNDIISRIFRVALLCV